MEYKLKRFIEKFYRFSKFAAKMVFGDRPLLFKILAYFW